jgi:hypothetical protein
MLIFSCQSRNYLFRQLLDRLILTSYAKAMPVLVNSAQTRFSRYTLFQFCDQTNLLYWLTRITIDKASQQRKTNLG